MSVPPRGTGKKSLMKLKVIVRQAEENGYRAEVPAIPSCATQGKTFDELLTNLHEAVKQCLAVDVQPAKTDGLNTRVLETAA